MTPLEHAREYYTEEELAGEIVTYMHCGHVLLQPDRFVLAREIPVNADPVNITNPWETPWDPDDCNCWYVHFGAGRLERILEAAPHPMEFVAFSRNEGALRVYPWDLLAGRIRSLSQRF